MTVPPIKVSEKDLSPISQLAIKYSPLRNKMQRITFFCDAKEICSIDIFTGGNMLDSLMKMVRMFSVGYSACCKKDYAFIKNNTEKVGFSFYTVDIERIKGRPCTMGFEISYKNKNDPTKRSSQYFSLDRQLTMWTFYSFLVGVKPEFKDQDLLDTIAIDFYDRREAVQNGFITQYELNVNKEIAIDNNSWGLGKVYGTVKEVNTVEDGSAFITLECRSTVFVYHDNDFKRHPKRYKILKRTEAKLAFFCSDITVEKTQTSKKSVNTTLEMTDDMGKYTVLAKIKDIETDGVYDYGFWVRLFSANNPNNPYVPVYLTSPVKTFLKEDDVVRAVCSIELFEKSSLNW